MKKGKALIVDSDKQVRGLLKELLLKEGYNTENILEARKGTEGIIKAIKEKPTLMIVDINLPDIHGDEIIRQLQENNYLSEAKVILMSVDPRDQSRTEGINTSFLKKPFDLEEFENLLRSL